MTNIEKYLNSIVDYMIRNTKNNQTPFRRDEIRSTFGLNDDEVEYVFYKYNFLMGWDSWDWSQGFLRKILKDY